MTQQASASTTLITYDAALALGKYVYALRDPRNNEVFYVGKGTGDRIIQHKKFSDENPDVASAKLDRIKTIESAGSKVEHLLLRTGLETDAEAFAVEQAVIDAFEAAKMPLTNMVKGHHSDAVGLKSLDTFLTTHAAEPLPAVDASLVMLKIQAKWSPDMSSGDIYDITRGHWVIGKDTRKTARYAFAVAYGIVRAVYRIDTWKQSDVEGLEKRWMFEGERASEFEHLVGAHAHKAFKKYAANPVVKFLDGYNPAN